MRLRQQLERIYDTYAELLFQYFRTRMRSDENARELLQDFFAKLGDKCSDDSIPANLKNEKAWIFAVARNLMIDRIRRIETRQRFNQALEDDVSHTNLFADSRDPDTTQLRERLSSALMDLPEAQRATVYLKLIAGMTFEEIATAEGISSNTAVSRYRYGIDKLQATLRPVYNELTKP